MGWQSDMMGFPIIAGGAAVSYLLRATWDSASDQGYADAQVLDTVGEGVEDGSLTVKEAAGSAAAVSNKIKLLSDGGANAAWGDLGVYSLAITKTLGYTYLCTTRYPGGEVGRTMVFWNDAASLPTAEGDVEYAIYALSASMTAYTDSGWGHNVIISSGMSADTDYQFALVLGGYDTNEIPWRTGETAADYKYGCAIYIKGGSYSNWTLLWRFLRGNDTPLYAGYQIYEYGTEHILGDDMKVPDQSLSAVLQPTALSTFTASNGTSLDAITPEVGGGWTEQNGDWEIQGNEAKPDSTNQVEIATGETNISDVLTDVTVDLVATPLRPQGSTLRYSDTNNYWRVGLQFHGKVLGVYETNGGVTTLRANTVHAYIGGEIIDIRAIADGQTIDGFVDGGGKVTYGSASNNETETKHGICGGHDVTTEHATFDNFAVYPRTSTTYTDEFDAV